MPDDPRGGVPLQRQLKIGLKHLQGRRLEEAEAVFSTAVSDFPQQPVGWLLRGIARSRVDRHDEAVSDIEHAVSLAPADAGLRVKAARALFGIHMSLAAMNHLEQAIALRPGDPEMHATFHELGLKIGWYREAFAAMDRALELDPRNHHRRVETARLLYNLRDYERAMAMVETAIEAGFNTAETHFLRSDILRSLERTDDAVASVAKALELDRETEEGLLRAVDYQIKLGAMVEAIANAERAVQLKPRSVAANLQLSQLRLWAGDTASARRHCKPILASSPHHVDALRVQAGCAVLEGNDEAALRDLNTLIETDEQDGEALIWRGEVRRRAAEYDASVADIDNGIIHSDGYNIPGHLSRLLSILETQTEEHGHLPFDAYLELLQILQPLLPDPENDVNCAGEPAEVQRLMTHAFTELRGNRTPRATYVRSDDHEAKLKRLVVPPHSRFASRYTQELIRTRPLDEVLALFDEKLQKYPDQPTVFCHIGELHLWLGRYEDALEAFGRAIAITEKVRWAYVGLCAAELMLGRFDRAIEWTERGIDVFPPPGRTIFIYRGETYRRMGRLDEALADVRESQAVTPGRISGWINLALIESAHGDDTSLVRSYRQLIDHAPALVQTAALEENVHIHLDDPDPAAIATLYEHALTMMRGNRSSDFVSYFTADGKLRFVPGAFRFTSSVTRKEVAREL